MKTTGNPKVDRTEMAETTNTAIEIILRDLNVLVGWAEADAEASRESDAPEQARDDTARARIYQRCRDQLDGAFK